MCVEVKKTIFLYKVVEDWDKAKERNINIYLVGLFLQLLRRKKKIKQSNDGESTPSFSAVLSAYTFSIRPSGKVLQKGKKKNQRQKSKEEKKTRKMDLNSLSEDS